MKKLHILILLTFVLPIGVYAQSFKSFDFNQLFGTQKKYGSYTAKPNPTFNPNGEVVIESQIADGPIDDRDLFNDLEVEAMQRSVMNKPNLSTKSKKTKKSKKGKEQPAGIVSRDGVENSELVLTPSTPSAEGATELSGAAEAKRVQAMKVIVDTARTYIGTKYLMGGTTRAGMDCSGLIQVSYKAVGKKMPRTSADLANFGLEVKEPKDLQVGDLVFFDSRGAGKINHVGIVTAVGEGKVTFIHSTSKGVMENQLLSGYWKDKYRKSMRVSV